MKSEDQVLSIEQVQELRELGFDVKKYASMCWFEQPQFAPIEQPKKYELEILTYSLMGNRGYLEVIPTMTIEDMIEVLPETIKTYSANADKEIYFYLRINNRGITYIPTMIDDCIFCSIEDELMNNLFNTLVWCIKEKHI